MKNKGLVLYWTDVVNMIAFGGLIMTGAVLHWVLPHGGDGAGRGRGHAIDGWIGLSRHEWGDIHFWIAVAAIGLLAFHLALHMGWIVSATGRYALSWSKPRPAETIVRIVAEQG